MKKSNVFFIASILSCVTGITVANIKLKSEYDNRNVASYYKGTSLPPFHHIKEVAIPDSAGFSLLEITITSSPDYKLLKPFYDEGIEKNLSYEVINDTLYIRMLKPFTQNLTTLNILCNNLQSIEGRHSRFFLNMLHLEKLNIRTEHVSFIKMENTQIRRLSAQGKDNSTLLLADKCKIDSGFFQMTDNSILSLSNNKIRQKDFLLGDQATLSLKGETIKEFIPIQKQ